MKSDPVKASVAFYERMLVNPCTHGPVICSEEKHNMIVNGLTTDTDELRALRTRAMVKDDKCRCCGALLGDKK